MYKVNDRERFNRLKFLKHIIDETGFDINKLQDIDESLIHEKNR